MKPGRRAVSLIAFAVMLVAAVWAQVTSGTITGTVTDSSGAAVVGAQITVRDTGKGTVQQYTTDEAGNYVALYLTPGTYVVTVEKPGFKRETSEPTLLDVDQRARVDFTLQVGQVSENVVVEATAPLVRSESAELGEVVNQRAVEQLPLNGRNFAQLVYLIPGVTAGQPGENLSGASTFNPRAASDFNALGSQANANAWLVDGIMDNEYTFNTVMVQPSVESIQEFKVLTGTYSAEFGRGAGIVTTQTRSGSNQFHGSAFEFLRNNYFDARNYFNTANTQKQPPYRRNQFGAAVGGPIWRNKTFFFADYYGWREIKGQTFVDTVPTAQDKLGNFSDLPNVIYNPFTTRVVNGVIVRDAFAGNIIPPNLINSVGLNVASLYPNPTQPGLSNNLVETLNRNLNDNGGNIRIDHHFSEKDSLFGRFSYERFILFDTKGQGGCCIPTPASAASRFNLGPFVAGGQNTTLNASGLALNETHVFSPTLVNEFIAGFARTDPLTLQSDYGHDAATSLGIMGINISRFTSGIPTINISGVPGQNSYTSLNGGPAFLPANPRQTSYQLQDSLSIVKGLHNLKVGYRIIRDDVSPFTNTNTRSALNFGLNLTNNPVTGNDGNGLATLLLGYLANGNSAGGSRGYLQTPYYLTVWEHAVYVQDDWKVTRRLTLNLGVRWDLFTPYTEQRNRLTNFDRSDLTLVYAGVNTTKTAGVQTRWNDVGPHIGFAFDPIGNGSTVIRGGYELSYFPEQPSGSDFLGQAVPWTISQNTPTEPLYPLGSQMSSLPTINNPFPAPVPVQPMTTAQLIAANPAVLGNSFTNQTPSYQSWSFNVERQLGQSMVAEVAYAGSRGVHLLYNYNPQEVEPGPATVPSNLRVTIPAIATVRNITQIDPRNSSTYHGLQAKLVKRFSHGVQFLASYTWSKSLDYGGSAASGGGYAGGPQTITDLAAGYGPSGFDAPQRFVGSWNWDLPFGKGQPFLNHGALAYIVGNWQLGGIATVQSGLPFTVYLASCVNNATNCWPDRIASGKRANPTYSNWYDPSAFEAPCRIPSVNGICPGGLYAYRYGDSGRGILRIPGIFNFDLSAVKNIPIKERVTVQFRLDAFNALNHPQLGVPNQNIDPKNPAATSTAITSTIGDNRDLQLALRVQF
ncbi:MAG: carboxypeptidase regulatory-like domain-containing protein [Acidobacteriaceae bacterium]|nr:carboxypeptidase regulatory-like domain-containing protein [Acidobacteriaceae bacterium]